LAYSKHLLHAAAVQYPALTTPVPPLLDLACANGDDALERQLQRLAKKRCRTDCFSRDLG
jgi:hypothetical protein